MRGGERGRPAGDLPLVVFALLAVCLPAGLLALHHDLGHQGDMQVFLDWYRAAAGTAPVYAAGSGVNYPIVGVALVCFPAWVVELVTGQPPSFEAYRIALKVLLSASEAGLILLVSPLARGLGISRPRLFALAVWIVPATWAGGSWFGQIDVVGSLWLAAAALGASRLALSFTSGSGGTGWSVLAACGLAGAVLTKPLTLFTVPALLLLALLGSALRLRSRARGRAAVGAAILAAVPALVMAPDLFLQLPEGYRSHVAHVLWGGGSHHPGDVLSNNGANLWALLASDARASSLATLYLGIPAKHWAIGLFGLTQAALAAWLVVEARPVLARPDADGVRGLAGSLILAAGVTNLAMATLLTGVHERYLYHGVLFLLLGLGARAGRRVPGARTLLAAGFLVCGWSGLFVLSSIHWERFTGGLAPFRSHLVAGILELGLLVAIGVHLVTEQRRGVARSPWQDPPDCRTNLT